MSIEAVPSLDRWFGGLRCSGQKMFAGAQDRTIIRK